MVAEGPDGPVTFAFRVVGNWRVAVGKKCITIHATDKARATASEAVTARKKENRQPKGGMGGGHAATTQGF